MRCAFLFVIITILLVTNLLALRINEVELNPPGKDAGNEWVELYSTKEIDLEGYKIVNNDEGEITLNGSFKGYFIVELEKQWLDNSDEKVFLYEGEDLIHETDLLKDEKNNDKTFQYCDPYWEFLDESKNRLGRCDVVEEEEDEQESDKEEEESEEGVAEGQETQSAKALEIIRVNPQVIKSTDDSDSNKEKDKSKYAIFSIIGLCVLIGILVWLRKNKYKNEFNN
jgi:hypothetical protein